MQKDTTHLGEIALREIAGAVASAIYRTAHGLDAYGYDSYVADLKKYTLPSGEELHERVEGWNCNKTQLYVYIEERPMTKRLS